MPNNETVSEALVSEFWASETEQASRPALFTDLRTAAGTAPARPDSSLKVALRGEHCEKIRVMCNHSEVLVFNFYATALSILLNRYFLQKEISFVSPYAQFRPGSNDFFLFRCLADEQRTFKEIFSASKEFLARSLANCSSMEQVRENTAPGGLQMLEEFGLLVNDRFEYGSSAPELIFRIAAEGEGFFFGIHFPAGLYDETLLQVFGYNFEKLLEQILERTYEPVGSLQFQHDYSLRLFREFNRVEPYYPTDHTLVEVITKQAELYPDKIAISCNGETITYAELESRTNRLAHALMQQHPLEADDLVAVMMHRSIHMAAVILAIWKTGAAYIPLDPLHPTQHLGSILQSAQPAILICNEPHEVSEQFPQALVLLLDELQEQADGLSSAPLSIINSPTDLAYVIYTSGSTGTPKGVMIEHFGMINHIGAKITEMRITPESRVAQNAPHTFDISVWQMFAPLAAGGTAFIYDHHTVADPQALLDAMIADRITLLELVPSYLVELLALLEIQLPRLDLDIIILNAETLMPSMVSRWLAMYPHIPIVNTYGATEASDDICHYLMYGLPSTATVPVMKKPIQHVQLHIVNEHLQLVPLGVKGEILLSGPPVGRGYLNDAERTARSFRAGPLEGVTTDQRIYRTGDIGRFRGDGTLEFLGRSDAQLKIRGHRIEPGEIEHKLMELPGIEQAAVIANVEQQWLAAYYQTSTGLTREEVAAHLKARLPHYMLPQYYVAVERFEVTPNGKINRRALPDPAEEGHSAGVEYVAPRNEVEKKLALVWQEILGREKIGLKDNFFDLGGHSLSATRLSARIHKEFEVKLPLREIFTAAVLEEQAQLIGQAQKSRFESIAVAPEQEDYPLSPSQRRLWVLSQFEAASIAYHMPGVYVFEGGLDIEALHKAAQSLVARHESLRTVFRQNRQGDVRQAVQPEDVADAFTIGRQDLRGAEDQQELVRKLVHKELAAAFNLSSGPLLRASLYQVEDRKWIFTYVMHHIIGDGWSTGVLIRELLSFYHAYSTGARPALQPLRIQYKDYAVWLQEQLSGENLKVHQQYWLKQFEGELPVLHLPLDKPRPVVKTYNGAVISKTINAELTNSLQALARRQDATLFIGLLTAVKALLYRYSGQDDIIVGSPIAGREHADLEGQIGFYVNTLALRSRLNGDGSFADLLRQVRNTTMEAYEHQVYPFDELVDQLGLARDISRNVLFDVMVVLQNADAAPTGDRRDLDKVQVSGYADSEFSVSKFDLLFSFTETGQSLELRIQYNTDLFNRGTIERMSGHLLRLIRSAVEAPTASLAALDYMAEEERQQLISAFNKTGADYPREKTLHALFEEQVEKTPGAIALVFGQEQYTYRELNGQANRLAHYLRAKYHISPDDRVGISLERGSRMIVSLLAVLKSGGAYVPIDPTYPQERNGFIVRDSSCKLVIDAELLKIFMEEEEKYSAENPSALNLQPSHLAYVIYTSGSTGKPKGVMVEHRPVVNYVFAIGREYGMNENERVLQTTSLAFDPSVEQVFLALLHGARLIVPDHSLMVDGDALAAFAGKNNITHLHGVPSLLKQIAMEKIPSLRRVVAAGEACPVPLAAGLWDKYGFYNKYGPTEATISCAAFRVREHPSGQSIPIGRPLSNYQVYILDNHLGLQPVGVAGEICIGGDGLARGYLDQPELTLSKFVDNPFRSGERMYRTGDMGRWLEDGTIEFIGRKDDQVKVRGYRIEPGEIESVLQSHPAITSCAVTARPISHGETELVAYITGGQELNASELRTWAGRSLPDYMVPSYFVQMDALPLTANGKIDRRSLPDPEGAVLDTGEEYVPARNETDEQLIAIWQEVLGREKVGIKDNFFDLGGNSLKLIRMVGMVNRQTGYNIPVLSAFRFPNVMSLSDHMSSEQEPVNTESDEEIRSSASVMEETFDLLNNYIHNED